MGAWGPKLYQDDIAEEVRDFYKDQLRRGKKGEEITRELIAQNEYALSDSDDAPVFWFALADTQWNLGRLENFVKEQALNHILNGQDLRRWETENFQKAKIRARVLAELEQKLTSPQPPKKKISLYKLYQCQWKEGDLYAYPLKSEYAKKNGLEGRYFLFHKISETVYWPGHIIPVVRVKITEDGQLPKSIEEFQKLEYVQTDVGATGMPVLAKQGYSLVEGKAVLENLVDEFGFSPVYRLELLNTSKRVIPKELIYLGNFQNVRPPKLEFVPNDVSIPGFLWKWFDETMIERYCGYNLRQYKIYRQNK